MTKSGLRVFGFCPAGSTSKVDLSDSDGKVLAKTMRRSEAPGLVFPWNEGQLEASKSKRSRFITLVHAATKSFTNFAFASELP